MVFPNLNGVIFYFLVLLGLPVIVGVVAGAIAIRECMAIEYGGGDRAWIEGAQARACLGYWSIGAGITSYPLTVWSWDFVGRFLPNKNEVLIQRIVALPWSAAMAIAIVLLSWRAMRFRITRLFPQVTRTFQRSLILACIGATLLIDTVAIPRLLDLLMTPRLWSGDPLLHQAPEPGR